MKCDRGTCPVLRLGRSGRPWWNYRSAGKNLEESDYEKDISRYQYETLYHLIDILGKRLEKFMHHWQI